MASLRDIRRRIVSLQSTHKITMAMEMVAASKLRRNQARIEALRPYADGMIRMMVDLAEYSNERQNHALLQIRPEVKSCAVVAMAGDRGLAGAFNANVVRRALDIRETFRGDGVTTALIPVGKRSIGTLRFRGCELKETWQDLSDHPSYSDAKAIASVLIQKYVDGEVDEVRLVYNHFTSAIQQTLMDDVILPIPRLEADSSERSESPITYNYEPEAGEILEKLLPAYVEIAVYRALLESSASEQGARMTAMRNASDSAVEMLDTLTLALNRARQTAITQEIIEVVGGAEALG